MITFPNSPLPTSASSTNSRSNRPHSSSAVISNERLVAERARGTARREPELDRYRDLSVGLIVTVELFDEPDADRSGVNLSDDWGPGENTAGIRGFGSCQSIISTSSMSLD